MAKKQDKKELPTEERLQKEKEWGIEDIQRKLAFINEPSYFFKVGDEVILGNIKKSIVDEIFYEGKVYGLKCLTVENNYGNPYDYEKYMVVPWMEIRPVGCLGDTNFSENQDVRIYFNNSTVDSLIHYHYNFGIDFNPDYQRGYVWSKEDKGLLLDSIFKNIDIGKFVLIHLSDSEWYERGFGYEILDGKQRLSTLLEFYENKLPYKGKYYNALSGMDKRTFLNHDVSIAEVRETDRQTILKYFLMLNRTGRVMDKSHLEDVEKMLSSME